MKTTEAHNHWTTIARHWSNVKSPLRPVAADCAHYATVLQLPGGDRLDALVLGATPELFHLPWPAHTVVRSADRSAEMSHAIWPGPAGTAFVTNWLDLPFGPESFDCIICDGGLHLLDYPVSQQRLPSLLARILKPGGRTVFRLFAMPDQAETASEVCAEVEAGRVASVHVFKLRMGMALQRLAEDGVVLGDVHEAIMARYGGFENLHAVTGWPAEEIATLASYCDSRNRYHFITKAQSIILLESGGLFAAEHHCENHYPLGERCPVVSFRKITEP